MLSLLNGNEQERKHTGGGRVGRVDSKKRDLKVEAGRWSPQVFYKSSLHRDYEARCPYVLSGHMIPHHL